MSWIGVLDRLEALLTAAGASLDPPLTHVQRGRPLSQPPIEIAYWYGGEAESATGGNTLTKTNVQDRIHIRCYWPLTADGIAHDVEEQIFLANRAICGALWGDVDRTTGAALNGNAIGVDIEDITAGWENFGDRDSPVWSRTLDIPILVDLAEQDVIGA